MKIVPQYSNGTGCCLTEIIEAESYILDIGLGKDEAEILRVSPCKLRILKQHHNTMIIKFHSFQTENCSDFETYFNLKDFLFYFHIIYGT